MRTFLTLFLQTLLATPLFAKDILNDPDRTGLAQSFKVPIAKTPDYFAVVSDDALLEAQLNYYQRQRGQWCMRSPVVCFEYVCLEDRTKLKQIQRRAAANANSKTRTMAVFMEVATGFLKRQFPEPLQIIESRDGYLYVRPPPLQGYVLSGRKLWEELEIKITASVADGNFNVTLVLDGRYAAGVNPPKSKNDYLDFEVEYPKHFTEYANKLASLFKSYLTASAQTAEAACSTRNASHYFPGIERLLDERKKP